MIVYVPGFFQPPQLFPPNKVKTLSKLLPLFTERSFMRKLLATLGLPLLLLS